MENSIEQPVLLIAPPPDKKLTERKVKYVINDRYIHDFEVLDSANGWWTDRTKVDTLIQSFKNGYNIQESCIYTGITDRQYQYFVELHPEFCHVKSACESVCNMIAETGNFALLNKGDGSQIRWYLERRKPDKYGNVNPSAPGPTINNFGTIINAPAQKVPDSVLARIKGDEQ